MAVSLSRNPSKQHADLTFKHNRSAGRHGWLRLTPAYSVKVVEEILAGHPHAKNIADPFSGTGTTVLCAAMRGLSGKAIDINPFLIWLGNAKLATYSKDDIDQVREFTTALVAALDRLEPAAHPPIFNIERWWSSEALGFLCRAKAVIADGSNLSTKAKDLVKIGFCRTMISISNAAFNHQSMSFKSSKAETYEQQALFSLKDDRNFAEQFLDDIEVVVEGAVVNPSGPAAIEVADARLFPALFDDGIDLLITSPPYPNRMSYIRELRPYMYWMGFLKEAKEAGELDWKAIGGTWGSATSRLATWELQANTFFPDYLPGQLDLIRGSDAKSGAILSNYVGKYFEDMWHHFQSVIPRMNCGAELHYVVGNSKFYDILLPVERIYRDMLLEAGAKSVQITPIRKRNSKKELLEFDVVATT